MSQERTCPDCGATLPADAPRGLCPNCLMGAALSRTSAPGREATGAFGPAGPRVLDTIAQSIGPVPRVLLRDTAPGETPGPVVRPDATDADPSIRYRIDGEIARGGMGAILKGRDPDLGRDVAIKVLRADLRDQADLVRRFVEEAQIGGQLQHPGVVPIYELGTFADRRPFFSMKLVKGQTLADLLAARSGPADDLPRLLSIFAAIAQTLAYSHTRGVIHRDLKPSNVMVGSFGEVQVMDWGLARVLPRGGVAADARAGKEPPAETLITTAGSGSDRNLSRAGSIMGTPSYMPPEQARGETDRIDERADVFALGSILCEVLTAKPAFTGRAATEILRKAADGATADAVARLDGCGAEAELIGLARDCLAVEPEGRPRDANAVAERITAYLAGVQERVQAAERERAVAVARATEERRRRKLQLGLAASLLALTTLGGLAFTYELHRRQAAAARVDRLLAEARLLHDQARDQPEDVARWERAREAVGRIGEEVGPAAAAALSELRREVEAGQQAARADRALVDRLVDIRSARADDPDGSATDAAYAAAFAAARIDPAGGDPAGAGAAVARRPRPVAAALVAGLDHWSDAKGPGWARVLAAARAADPDPDRDALRAALLVEDKAERLRRLRPLAERADAGSWAPTSLVLLGAALADAGDVDAGLAVLRRASWAHPEDAPVHHALGRVLEGVRPPQAEEAILALSVAWGRQPELAGHELAHALERRGRGVEAEAVWRDLVGRRPENGRHLGCYGRHLKERGRGAEAAAVLARAVAALREAIRLKPDDAPAHFNLGLILFESGDVRGAIAACREAIRLRPDAAEAHSNLGLALRESGDVRGAIAAHREAIRLKPDAAEAHTNLGNALSSSGDVRGAIAAHREAIRLKPDLAAAHSNLGIALHESGDVRGAIAAYREAIRLKPDYAAAHNNLGAILCDVTHDYAGAEAEFREAIRLKPDDALAHFNLGNALHGSADARGAIAAYREAIRLKPDYAAAHSNLGNALSSSGDVRGAIAALREAIRLKPDLAAAHCNLGSALLGSGDLRGAIAAYREAIRLKPDAAGAHSNLGFVLGKSGDARGAIAALREAIRLKPDDAVAHFNLGIALHESGDVRGAIAAHREAIRLRPDDAGAHDNLGLALRESGDVRGAIAAHREAIRLRPDDAGAHYNLGNALQAQGKPDEAIAEWRTALKLNPDIGGASWPAHVEALAAVAPRLPALLKGEDRPRDAAEALALAQLMHSTQHYAQAARLYRETFAGHPELADGVHPGNRFDAACAAARAGAVQGQDKPPLDEPEKARWRKQALDWLREHLAMHARQLGDPKERGAVPGYLLAWQANDDLAGIRDEAALAKLPGWEQKAFTQLWADVAALLEDGKRPDLASLLEQLPEARKGLPKDSPQLAGLLAQIGQSLLGQKQWIEAEAILRECLAIRERSQPDEWSTFNTRSLLGGSLLGQKKYAEAEPLIVSGYEGMKAREARIPPPGKPRFAEGAERVIRLYEEWGKKEKAAEWRTRLAKPTDGTRNEP